MRMILGLLFLGQSFLAPVLFGQEEAIAFDAASLKPTPVGPPTQYMGFMGGPGSGDPGRITSSHTSLKMFIMRAYDVKAYQVVGPGWLETESYDLVAKVPAGATNDQVRAMMRNLLAERFKLAQHRDAKEMSVYTLVAGKDGPKLTETSAKVPEPDSPPAESKGPAIGADGFPILRPGVLASGPIILFRNGQARLLANGLTIPRLANSLSQQLDRMVIDETGLTGKYDVTLTWTPDRGPNLPPPTEGVDAANDIFTAIQRQLGLRLVSKKAPVPVIVVDRMEKVPAGN
ncbi:MAG TPA: TIGR03435 family protein [Candidatus Sulfopaludibacter sp.]|jgi:uncharacterized protein (TIGR03435 family)|nr:TIGR03435 family protein [Candidatus Sulfopaludibacter sp.]